MCIIVVILQREEVDKTYCRRRWGVEWHHFPWQLYESTQQAGQCRLWDRAKPYSLSTCCQPICSICSLVFWGIHEERLFLTCVYFLFPSVFPQFQGPWMKGQCPVLKSVHSFGAAEDVGLKGQPVTSPQDRKPPPISLHACTTLKVSAQICKGDKTTLIV